MTPRWPKWPRWPLSRTVSSVWLAFLTFALRWRVARWQGGLLSRGGLCKNAAVFVYILQVHLQMLPRSTKKSVVQYKAVKWNRWRKSLKNGQEQEGVFNAWGPDWPFNQLVTNPAKSSAWRNLIYDLSHIRLPGPPRRLNKILHKEERAWNAQ